MTDDQLIQELRAAFDARTAQVHYRPEAVPLLPLRAPRAPRRGRIIAPMIAAAASVVGALVIGAQVGSHSGHEAVTPGAGGTLSTPYPTSGYFLASRGQTGGVLHDIAVVRAMDGAVVASVPVKNFSEAVLSPDGSRVYGAWGGSPGHVGYYDLASGRTVTLDTRSALLVGVTVSADGSTLAYEWDAKLGQPENSSSVVILNLLTGAKRVLRDAPAGPQVMSMSLSPSGDRLAVLATDSSARPLLIVDTSNAHAFQHPLSVPFAACADAWTAEPRWTRSGLYALRSCSTQGYRLVRIDPTTRTVQTLHIFGAAGILAYTVIPQPNGDVFAVSDESVNPPSQPVLIYKPNQGWASAPVPDVKALIEITSE